MIHTKSPEFCYRALLGLTKECEQGRRRMTRLYFIRFGPDGPIKIGIADDPGRRLFGLQAGSPYELVLLGDVAAPERFERFLHRVFADDRIRREWFEATDELVALAEQLPVLCKKTASPQSPTQPSRPRANTGLKASTAHWPVSASDSPLTVANAGAASSEAPPSTSSAA